MSQDEIPTVPVDAVIQYAAKLSGESEELVSRVLDGMACAMRDIIYEGVENRKKQVKIHIVNFGVIGWKNQEMFFDGNTYMMLALNQHYYEASHVRRRGIHLKVKKDWVDLYGKHENVGADADGTGTSGTADRNGLGDAEAGVSESGA